MRLDETPPPNHELGPDDRLLDRYLAGECSLAERQSLEAWLHDQPQYAARLGVVSQIALQATLAGEKTIQPGEAFIAFRHRLSVLDAVPMRRGHGVSADRSSLGSPLRSSWRSRRALISSVALGTLIAVALITVTIRYRAWSYPSPTRDRMYVAQTRPGQRAPVRLADGTQVHLAVASTIRYSADSRTKSRIVKLDGEAYFDVHEQPGSPFIIRTGNLQARVLGTTFTVRHYSTDHLARVMVATGRVAIQRLSQRGSVSPTAVLTAHTLGAIDDSGHVSITPNIVVDDYLAAVNGKLVFQQTPVQDIVIELSRAYNADIRVADSTLARRALTWTVPVHRLTLASAVGGLADALEAHAVRSGTVITIVAGSAPTRRSNIQHPISTSESSYGR